MRAWLPQVNCESRDIMSANHEPDQLPEQSPLKGCRVLLLAGLLMGCGADDISLQPQTAFDLVCTSQAEETIRFRFDLSQSKWCLEDCAAAWTIDEQTDAEIKLSLRTRDDSDRWSISIDRYTSQFWIVRRGYGKEPQAFGQCERHKFSGFPQQQF